MKCKFIILCLLSALTGGRSVAALGAEDPAHNQLRTLRTEVIEAITKGDIDTILKRVHTNVVVTWQNGEVCRGHQGLRDFYQRMGKQAFQGYKIPPTPDELTILSGGNHGISFGNTVANYHLLGQDLELKSRWTATLLQENGQWLLASYHVSMNVLDNPLINAAKKSLLWVGAAAAISGLVIGVLVGRRKRR